MDIEGLRFILHSLGCKKMRPSNNGILCSCPFAPYGGHKDSRDLHPSFSISVSSSESLFYCFACGRKGTTKSLLYQFREVSGQDVRNLFSYVKENEEVSLRTRLNRLTYNPGYREVVSSFPKKQLEEGWFEREDLNLHMDDFKQYLCYCGYMNLRGITEEQAKRWNLGVMNGRIFIPILDIVRHMHGYSLRAMFDEDTPKYLHCPGMKKEKVLYGSQFLDRSSKTAFIMEGFMDVLRLERFGVKNCFAIMGTSLSIEQAKFLLEHFEEVIILPHNDQGDDPAGLRMANQSKALLLSRKRNFKVIIGPTCPDVKDPGDMTDEQVKWMFGILSDWRKHGVI